MLTKFFLQFILNILFFFLPPPPFLPILLSTLLGAVLGSPHQQLRALPCKRAAAHEVAELALESSVW